MFFLNTLVMMQYCKWEVGNTGFKKSVSWTFMLVFLFLLAACGCLQAVQLLCEHKCPINVKDLVRTSSPIVHFKAFTSCFSQSQVSQFKAILLLYFILDFSGREKSFCSLPQQMWETTIIHQWQDLLFVKLRV